MKKFLQRVFCFHLGVLFAVQVAAEANALFPVGVGSSWVYRVHFEGELPSSRKVENRIVDSVKIGEKRWFQLQEYGENFWVRNGQDGQIEAVNLYRMKADDLHDLDPKVVREEVMFRFPVELGESWVTLENTVHYHGVEEKQVPAGKFQCHLYSLTQYQQTYSHSCIAQGVGVVYSDNILEDGRREISELLEWKVHQ